MIEIPVNPPAGVEPHPTGMAGLASARSIVFPVSRRYLLGMLRPDLPAPKWSNVQMSAETAALVNGEIASAAREYVLHHPDDNPFEGIGSRRDLSRKASAAVAQVPGTPDPDPGESGNQPIPAKE